MTGLVGFRLLTSPSILAGWGYSRRENRVEGRGQAPWHHLGLRLIGRGTNGGHPESSVRGALLPL
jgi:hypothetical protein